MPAQAIIVTPEYDRVYTAEDYEITYEFNDDGTCTAKAVAYDDPTNVVTETVTAITDVKTPVTCLTDGLTTYTAVFTEHTDLFETQTTDKTITHQGHQPGEAVKENVIPATCLVDGSYDSVVYCTVCTTELSRDSQTDKAKGHEFIKYVYNNDATTEKDGTETAKCENCTETDTRTVSGTKIKTYTVTFMADDKLVENVVYTEGSESVTEPKVPDKDGYEGKWDTYTLNDENITVKAVYTPITYYATFMADGKQVGEKLAFTIENMNVSAPDVPKKDGYTGKWEDYTLAYKDITIKAEYEIITYYATFMADDKQVGEKLAFTVEDMNVSAPEVPKKDGYTGKWEDYTLAFDNITINAEYEIITYYATFTADDKQVGEKLAFTVNNMSVSAPEVPDKPGYTGKWEDYTLTLDDITIKAVYTPITYHATFKADGKQVGEVLEFNAENMSVEEPAVPEKEGFYGAWEDYTLTYDDITINAIYSNVKYTVEFVAEGKSAGTVEFIFGQKSVKEPAVPEKAGYEGKWEAYTLGSESITVKAVYTPITYYATFMAGEQQIGEKLAFTVENMKVNAPEVPDKPGYTGEWEEYTLALENITVNAVYTPITYYATFMAGEQQVGEKLAFTVEDMNVSAPEVPDKQGYTGKWEDYTLALENITINAVYTPITYYATFMAGDQQVGETLEFNVENMSVSAPEVPDKPGYTGKWEDYVLGLSNITIKAVYTPITYYATFMAGEQQVGEKLAFTVENMKVTAPAVPEKTGYTGKWEDYTLTLDDITVNAEYEIITYYVTFMADGQQVGEKLAYTVENKAISEPAVPEKEGYTGKWDTYTLDASNITVNAVYTKNYIPNENAEIKIANEVKYDYRTKVTIVAKGINVDEGYHLELVVNGTTYKGDRTKVTSDEFELKSDTSYTVKVVKDDTGAEQTNVEKKSGTVRCDAGFFKKIAAFFKGLFGSLPKKTVQP